MRSKGVKLSIYDEPSASLDPKAEFGEFKPIDLLLMVVILMVHRPSVGLSELFERLRAMKGQRTMLFITQYVLLPLSYNFSI